MKKLMTRIYWTYPIRQCCGELNPSLERLVDTRNSNRHRSDCRKVPCWLTRETNQQMAEDLFDVVGSGKVKIYIEQRYPLAEAAQAHRDLEARKTTGCTVLTL